MIHALVLAAVGQPLVPLQTLATKTIDIDKFDTPLYSQSFTKGQSGGNEWFDLTRAQCLFPRRAVYVHVGPTSNGTLTLTIGNHEQRIDTTASMAWSFYLQDNTDGSQSVDLSAVDLFMVDFTTVPAGKIPDIPYLYVGDVFGHSSSVGWHIRTGGIYFRKSEFSSNIDWKHVTFIKFRQDFDAFPNPTTYSVTRFYATLKPVAVPPAPAIPPLGLWQDSCR